MKFVVVLKKFYAAIQKPLAFICIFVAVLGNALGLAGLQYAAVLAIGFVLLQILFEIHSGLFDRHDNSPKIYENYYTASLEMERLIDEQVKRNKSISLKWLGTCMDYGWSFLRSYLIKITSLNLEVSVQVEIAMLAPDWSDVSRVNLFWQAELKSQYDAIKAFINNNPNTKIEIKLHTYKHMPYHTGLLINNRFLFLGLCEWSAGQYAVGSNHYTLYIKGNGTEHEIPIAQYESWFSFCSETHNTVNNSPTTQHTQIMP